jgi:alanyl-tRNA synthetase
LKAQLSFVEEVIREEEVSFLRTLQSGIKRFQAIREETEGSGKKMISGARVFELFDTYGFPVDLTRLMASELGLQVDEQGFEKEMEAQRSRARKAGATEQTDWVLVHEGSKTVFTGYDSLQEKSQILRYRKVKSKDQEVYHLVLDRSPFYAESGGQVGDTGELDFGTEVIRVSDTRKENDLLIHICTQLPSHPELGITARVDANRRTEIRKNHSATHLLQAALREVLGNHVEQKGSLVGPDYLRFDFSHFSKLSREELQRIEWRVNEKIQQNITLDEQRELPIAEALSMGATALFGEKYGETVRMITFDPTYSRELCGGTHVQATGEIGLFKLLSEGSVAAGVRRIEAITGLKALEWAQQAASEAEGVRALLKNPKDTGAALEAVLLQQEEMRKKLERLQEQSLNGMAKELWSGHVQYNGIGFLSAHLSEIDDAESMRKLGMFLSRLAGEKFVLLLHTSLQGKYMVHLRTDSAHTGWNANQLLKELAPEVRGGGPSDFVQAVAPGPEAAVRLSHALEQKIQSAV